MTFSLFKAHKRSRRLRMAGASPRGTYSGCAFRVLGSQIALISCQTNDELSVVGERPGLAYFART